MFKTPKGMSSFLPNYLHTLVCWIEENNFDPYLIVNRHADGVELPPSEKIQSDETIWLNLASRTYDRNHFYFTENHFEYKTSFGGTRSIVKVPYSAMIGLVAKGCEDWSGEDIRYLCQVRDGLILPFYAIGTPEEGVPVGRDLERVGLAIVDAARPTSPDIAKAFIDTMLSPVEGKDLVDNFFGRYFGPGTVDVTETNAPAPDVVTTTTTAPDPTTNVVYGAFGQRKKP